MCWLLYFQTNFSVTFAKTAPNPFIDRLLSLVTSAFDVKIWWHATMAAHSSAQGSTCFDMFGLIWVLHIVFGIFTSNYFWSQNSSAFDIHTNYNANTLYRLRTSRHARFHEKQRFRQHNVLDTLNVKFLLITGFKCVWLQYNHIVTGCKHDGITRYVCGANIRFNPTAVELFLSE